MSNTLQPLSDHWRNRYLLMRHGHSQANQQGVIVSSPERGIERFGLSEHGEQQLAQLVADWQWPVPTRVVHSDFLRTRQTAAHVAARFGLVPSVDTRLRERNFGELEGQGDDHYPSVWALDAEDAEHRHYQVEALSGVASRMQAVIAEWEQQVSGETILLVSHGDPLQILLTALANKPLTQHREQPALLPASITQVGD
ncbi:histidine phosphatase family protein [Halomonas sp. FeN2]|uniref:histidine phosphatase family protein n=1 Tax=Halomonas sp. FeN2 TaxID=2832500 RepID=UPI000C54340B|nr:MULTISPECIES: histidine phosphatase family protein [unclassified Halomonas]MBF57919.1 histidine phosphatase family protein [Halomonas sp.]TDV97282.1 putative phosphoglycerate mutase [Halomonas alkaliantarctica]UBR51778.1 histidine phosphatase family protein [Halomonas sp. FeN2]|tara:strand:+ start:1156 stop:1749 length:594 start_codon:yes stop_codon:yes gene_type:complete